MEKFDKNRAFKAIPPVGELLGNSVIAALTEQYGRLYITGGIKLVLDKYREEIMNVKAPLGDRMYDRSEVTGYLAGKLRDWIGRQDSGLKKVINATGIVLHTNLGRAPLPQKAIDSIGAVCGGYCNLELDLESGTRGSRHTHIEALITQLTGAESALLVNNNAAAVFLCLNTLAQNREVIVSRGQQVEIGGSFRIPDIITRSGAEMAEVGTTNKTRLSDYSNAVTDDTAMLLKVHTSNYRVTGFTEEVPLRQLVELGREKGLTVVEDLGSGCLYDLSELGLPYEPTVQDSIKEGADLVTFSGDKLLGGIQAGIIAGKKELVEKIKKNPLLRMVRCDKMTIATTAEVLKLYKNPKNVVKQIPVLRMMLLKKPELEELAAELAGRIQEVLNGICKAEVADDLDEIGGGSLPGVILDGKAAALSSDHLSAADIQTGLRNAQIPVISHISRDRVLLNVRTIEKNDFPAVVKAIAGVFGVSL